jgi:epoxyqueuosine reductase
MAPGQSEFLTLLLEAAREEGFPLVGAVDIAKAQPRLSEHVARYDRWLAEGRAGAMEYLVRGRDRRADPTLVMAGARAILSVAIPYGRAPVGEPDAARGVRYARYLPGRDYHRDIGERLEKVMTRARERPEAPSDLAWKVCVDTSAVLERAWAAMAGLGWIGKNTLLIHPKLGSYLFIGQVLINHETGAGPAPLPDYCGHCRRCLEGCPTSAITAPRELDSRRCISYATLEKRGAYPDEARPRSGSSAPWVAGCDVCQEVCPFNIKPSAREAPARDTLPSDWQALLEETEEAYRERVQDSALSRVKPAQFRRNLAASLAQWLGSLGPADRANWSKASGARLEHRVSTELDPDARHEWERCLELLKV